ncbi:mechanosensitive ion channel family protein [Pseudodesulfovibrio sp.]|uniref:mechanosensitive ion channel family protein n=1 Tax=unclassified Pseudodesulfovibrio TaxID=2661612 RepID=UPI003B003A81
MPANVSLPIYLVCISGVALCAYLWLHIRLSSFKEKRVSRIKDLVQGQEINPPVSTDILSDKQERRHQQQIIQGVRSRFTIIRRTLILLVLIAWCTALTLPFLGKLPSTMLSILIAVTTAVVGIAARPLVENMISGIVISFSRQLRVGDTLMMDGQYGTVEDISITHTKIKTWDWKRYVIPNSRMLNKEFVNMTLNDSMLWAYLEFSVSYEADLDQVRNLAVDLAEKSPYHNAQEEPQFWVMRMERESVICWIAAWADSPAEAWSLKSDMAIGLTKAFRELSIPAHTSYVDLRHGRHRHE